MVKTAQKKKTSKQLERHMKGLANHWRLDILFVLGQTEGLTLDDIANQVGGNIKTISEHTRRLAHAGLLNKTYQGREVAHTLSPYGRRFLKFIKTFSYS